MEIKVAKSYKDRLMGLMFRKNINYVLKIERCNSIHTFFMREPIDVYLVDKSEIVIFVFKNLKRNRIILPKKGVTTVYETPIDSVNLKIGDKFSIKKSH